MKRNTTGIMESLAMLQTIENGVEEFNTHLADTGKAKEYQKGWQRIVALGEKFKETEENKRAIFKAAYGAKTAFSIRKTNAMLRLLAEWIDEFSLGRKMERSGFAALLRADNLRDSGNTKEYKKALQLTIEKAVDKDETTRNFINLNAYEALYRLEKRNKIDLSLLNKADEALDNFILINKLKSIIERTALCINGSQDFDEKLLKEQRIFPALAPPNPIPLIFLQILVLKYYEVRSHEAYLRLKSAYFENIHLIKSEKKFLLLYLMNALAFMKPPMENVMQEYLSLFKFGFENGIFLEDGELEAILFSNFVFTLKSLRQYSLLEEFITSHSHLIKDEKERIAALKMAKCYLLIGEGKHFTALKDLAFVDSSYPVFTIRKYMAEIICIFEHEEEKYDAFLKIKKVDVSFKRLLQKYRAKGKINQDYYETVFNFLEFVLITSNTIKHKNTRESLTDLLNSYEGLITEKSWILEKIAEHK